MQIYIHIATGHLLNEGLNNGESVGIALFSAVAPDLPFIANFLGRGVKKKFRNMTREDICTVAPVRIIAHLLHSLVSFSALGIALALFAPHLLAPYLIGWGSHLTLDYLSHHTNPYPPFYPLSKVSFASPFSYYEPNRHSRAINFIAGFSVTLGYLSLFIS